MHVHRSKNEDDNNFLYHTTSKLIEERNPVRTTNGWNGVGIMVGIGEHLNRNGQHTDFVLKPKYRTMWSNEEEKMTMSKCGGIFEAQFKDKSVGYKEMIDHQKRVWPDNCPSRVTDIPRCWNASQNLGNELHNDCDADRSFAVWTNEKKNLQIRGIYSSQNGSFLLRSVMARGYHGMVDLVVIVPQCQMWLRVINFIHYFVQFHNHYVIT